MTNPNFEQWNPIVLECPPEHIRFQTNCCTPKEFLSAAEEFAQKYKAAHARLASLKRKKDFREIKAKIAALGLAPKLDYFTAKEGEPIFGEFRKGLLPDLRHAHLFLKYDYSQKKIREEVLKSLKYWWPVCPVTHRRMAYLGWVDAGYYPYILHELLGEREYNRLWSYFGSHENADSTFRFHFYAGEQQECYGFNKDIHIEMETRRNGETWNDLIPKELYDTLLQEFLRENPIVERAWPAPPEGKLSAPKLGFDLEISAKNRGDDRLYLHDWEDEDSTEYPEFTLFGKPRSQQEPKRPMCPNSYPRPHALIPTLNFSDREGDVTHQFYADFSRGLHVTPSTQYALNDASNT